VVSSYDAEKPPTRPDGPRYFRPRREKIAEEIRRNRERNYRVPTWVLALILVAIVAAYAAIVIIA
jgi:type VI protein secretion system component VasF